MWPAFEQALPRYGDMESHPSDPVVSGNCRRFTQFAKEQGSLAKLLKPYLEYQDVSKDIGQAEALIAAESDPEMRQYAEEELAGKKAQQQLLTTRLEDLLLVDPGEDYGSVIVEIRAGTGGDEAALFAGDLYNMYTHFARDQRWKVEDISFSPGEQGGYKDVVFSVSGDQPYLDLRYESGGARGPRLPKTETHTRIQPSA